MEQVHEQLLNFPLIWEHLDSDEKRQVLSLLIEDGGLTVDRIGRDIKLRLNMHLLPEVERTIIYRNYRGINRTKAQGLQRLTQRQMVLLYHAGQGKSRKECAELMGCKVHSIISIEKTICKNLGDVSWEQAVEMAGARVNEYASRLPFGSSGRAQQGVGERRSHPIDDKLFLSPVLMEVFRLFAEGAKVPEVAKALHLTETTVQGRQARILKTFGTGSIYYAVQQAKAYGLLYL